MTNHPINPFTLDHDDDLIIYRELYPAKSSESRLMSYQRSIRSLPLPPALWQAFQKACNADASSQKLAEIIKADPVLAAAILRTVNSASLHIGPSITDVGRAIAQLGTSMTRSIVAKHAFTASTPQGKAYDVKMLWKHGMAVSALAEIVAEYIPNCSREEAGTLGLFHDIGRMSFNLLTEYMQPATLNPDQGHLMYEVQRFGCTHVAMGELLGKQWQLPDKIIRGMIYHHHPAYADPETIPQDIRAEVLAVYIADLLTIHLKLSAGDIGISFPKAAYADMLQSNITLHDILQHKRIASELTRIEAVEF